MDAAYYEDLAGRLYGLLITLEDHLDSEQAQLLHHFIEVGEYGLALEEIVGVLAQAETPITDQERGDKLALTRRMKMNDLVPHASGSARAPITTSADQIRPSPARPGSIRGAART